MTMTPIVRGIDVSNNNPRQDWAAHRRDGVAFAFIKATEGNHSRDPLFSAHMHDAKAAKVPVLGAYHFAWPVESPDQNATNYITAVRPFAGLGFVHWLDLEPYADRRNYAGRTHDQIHAWCLIWLARVRSAFPGQRVGIYAGAGEDLNIPPGTPRWFPSYPWPSYMATYERAAAHPRIRGDALFWQFTGSPLDRSIYYGTLGDLQKWALGTTAPAKPKPKSAPARPRYIRVRTGMTLSAIALVLGSTVGALAHYNHISNPDRIYPGQVISAPPSATPHKPLPARPNPTAKPTAAKPKPAKPKVAAAPAWTVHVVRRHETLSGIAAAAHIRDWHTLSRYNHIAHPNLIYPGQRIRIPKGR